MDDVYTRICDLGSVSRMLSADLYHHKKCYNRYTRDFDKVNNTSEHDIKVSKQPIQGQSDEDKTKESNRQLFSKYIPFITAAMEKGHGLSITDIRKVCAADGLIIANKYIKMFLADELEDLIQFSDSDRKNVSQFVFSSRISVLDVVNLIRYRDDITDAATTLRNSFMSMDFGLSDKFCDFEELKQSWFNTNIPDNIVSFFTTLFDINKARFLEAILKETGDDHESIEDMLYENDEADNDENDVKDKETDTEQKPKRSSQREVNYLESDEDDDDIMFCDKDDPEWNGGNDKNRVDKSSEEKDDDNPEDMKVEGRKKKLFQRKVNKVKCLIQIIYYSINNGRKKTPFHVWTSVEVYNRCRSRELMTMLNRMSLCLSYKAMRNHRTDLMKYAIWKSAGATVPIPSHFSLEEFTTAAFDNFNHADRNSLSGKSIANDTAITVFQTIRKVRPTKPKKSDCDLKNVDLVPLLPCQIKQQYTKSSAPLKVPSDFIVSENLLPENESLSLSNAKDELTSLIMCKATNTNLDVPSWGGIRSLMCKAEVPLMHTGFLPFLPHPVTEYATVYTALKNFVSVCGRLQQRILPVFCDEGVFRIFLDIFLAHPTEFDCLLPMLGSFHMAKIALGAAGKYVKGSGLDDTLVETQVFGIKTIEAVLGGTHYVRSIRGLQILAGAIQKLKWDAFWRTRQVGDYEHELGALDGMISAYNKKESVEVEDNCKKHMGSTMGQLLDDFHEFSKMCAARSEVCRYWDGFLDILKIIQGLVAADREGDWDAHLSSVQKLLPVFRECDNINYLRYASWYLEKMRKLPTEHPDIHTEFKENRKFVVKTTKGVFNAVGTDMKLEQSIQRSQKRSRWGNW